MACVKTKDIPFNERYVRLVLDKNILSESTISNLRLLYEFIDKNSGKSLWKYGNAYRRILKRAREYAGYQKKKISKRQVSTLINVQKTDMGSIVKIPYASEYIFKAIFNIFENIKEDKSIIIPPEIIECYGKVRREVFYCKQCEQYEYKYLNGLLNEREELEKIRRDLLNDICSEECSLGKEF